MMSTVVVPSPYTYFDRNAKQYRCCCDSCHVTTGTKVIGILEAIGLALEAIGLIYNLATFGFHLQFIISLVFLAIYTIILVFLFLGLQQERAGYLMPHLVVSMIGIILLGIALIGWIIMLAIGGSLLKEWFDKAKENEANRASGRAQIDTAEQLATGTIIGIGVAIALVMLLSLGVAIWFFLVVLNCYRYFRDKALYGDNPVAQVAYTNTVMQPPPPLPPQPPQAPMQHGQYGYNDYYAEGK